MRTRGGLLWLVGVLVSLVMGEVSGAEDQQSLVVVIGAPGEPEYGRQFATWAARWEQAAQRATARCRVIGRDATSGEDRDALRVALSEEQTASRDTLWLVLLGHGTFDGKVAKFNLRGPDVSASELAEWLQPHQRPLVLINAASGSGAFLPLLSGPGRVIITATRSGREDNYSRFGDAISEAIGAPSADLDKDGQTSVLEAYLEASHRVAEFYATESRLATEHALLDDNGDRLGTGADWFQGVRATRKAQNAREVDGRRARQIALIRNDVERGLSAADRAKRDELELQLERLRDQKESLPSADYFQKLEAICLQIAAIYEAAVEP